MALLSSACADTGNVIPQSGDFGVGKACTIEELRHRALGKRPADGARVTVYNAVVIGIRAISSSHGYYIRQGKGDYQAIYVFTGEQKSMDDKGIPLRLGDRVTVTGTLKTFYSTDELIQPITAEVTGNGKVTPVDVSTLRLQPGTAGAEALESQLVRVTGVKVAALVGDSDNFWVTSTGSACSGASPPCAEVSDFHLDNGAKNGQPAVKVGQTFSAITGIVGGHRDRHTLNPRMSSDLVQ